MQGQDTQKQNVVSLFGARDKANGEATDGAKDEPKEGESFSDVMNRNQKNAERMAKERLNANKSVLRSYRIKH